MRAKFDEQLEQLNKDMIEMGNLIEKAIQDAIEAYINNDVELAQNVIAHDDQINQMQKQIETVCIQLLMQQQPVAKDLRVISAAMKMVTDMERIGDQAADISEIVLQMIHCPGNREVETINRMARETILMLIWSIEAYVEQDRIKAEKVIGYDDVVDELFEEAKKDLVEMINDKPELGERATDMLMIAKYFERIGDHATNIAEWVIFSLRTGRKE